MQNVKTLQIHIIRNSDFDTRNSDFYSGSWEFHTQALELEFLNIIRVNHKVSWWVDKNGQFRHNRASSM
jgi:hypothetical protein